MAAVDVRVERVIHAALHEVAAYAADPSNAPEWYANIDSVEWCTDPPVMEAAMRRATSKDLARVVERRA